ncbi:MAG: SPT3 Dosage dependent suppressor of Ty-induced promoter mutations-like protein [Chaenotheca gracillima]|nr:MAG: SPT3 Dosage dependent suppressor of Ty-induced promoter mutations-like protein [Chaenotheca gracillima]
MGSLANTEQSDMMNGPPAPTINPNLMHLNTGNVAEANGSSDKTNMDLDLAAPSHLRNLITPVAPSTLRASPISAQRPERAQKISLVLSPIPEETRHVRLPFHTLDKPERLGGVESTSLRFMRLDALVVRSTDMQDATFRARALNGAWNRVASMHHHVVEYSNGLVTGAGYLEVDYCGDLTHGHPVCARCIQRESKRYLSTKRHSNRGECVQARAWESVSVARTISFNSSELVTMEPSSGNPNAVELQLDMRLVCLSKHHGAVGEGDQVIFTILDPNGALLAQTVTNPIQVRDGHRGQRPPKGQEAPRKERLPEQRPTPPSDRN